MKSKRRKDSKKNSANAEDKSQASRPKLIGSLKIVGDLEEGSREITELFHASLEESAKKVTEE